MKRLLAAIVLSFLTIHIAVASETVTYVDLIRLAWQQRYAPKRLLPHSAEITQTPLRTNYFIPNLVHGNPVFMHPLSEWHSKDNYVTTILLRNKYFHATDIDIRKDLCGDWKAAVIYPHEHLKPYGNKDTDSTLLFLVSNRPFNEMMRVCYGHA